MAQRTLTSFACSRRFDLHIGKSRSIALMIVAIAAEGDSPSSISAFLTAFAIRSIGAL
jgi:hypothetical protein